MSNPEINFSPIYIRKPKPASYKSNNLTIQPPDEFEEDNQFSSKKSSFNDIQENLIPTKIQRKETRGSQLFNEYENKFYKRGLTVVPKASAVKEFNFLKSPIALKTITENSNNEDPEFLTNKELIKRLATESNSLYKGNEISFLPMSSRLSRSDVTMSYDESIVSTRKGTIREEAVEVTRWGRVYVDDIFPPNITSLVNNKRKSPSEFKRFFQFLRLKQIYSSSTLTLAKTVNPKYLRINERLHPGFAQALFILSNHPMLIERIFKKSIINKEGLYTVLLYFNGVWKEIIVDDSFPVDLNKKTFLVEQLAPNLSDFDIWPLLVQKAIAKVYGTYESMLPVNTDYILHLITGLPIFTPDALADENPKIEFVAFSKKAQYLHVLSRNLEVVVLKDYVSFIGENCVDLPIEKVNTQEMKMKIEEFDLLRLSNYVIPILSSFFCNISSFKHLQKTYSIRKLCVKSKTKMYITISQSDKSLFRKINYEVSPVRLFVVKVLENEELKICAKAFFLKREYSMEIDLKSGIYLIFIMIDWDSKPYRVGISIYSDLEISLSRISYRDGKGLLEFALKTEIFDQGDETNEESDKKLYFQDENFSYISYFFAQGTKSSILNKYRKDNLLMEHENIEDGDGYHSPGILIIKKNPIRQSLSLF